MAGTKGGLKAARAIQIFGVDRDARAVKTVEIELVALSNQLFFARIVGAISDVRIQCRTKDSTKIAE